MTPVDRMLDASWTVPHERQEPSLDLEVVRGQSAMFRVRSLQDCVDVARLAGLDAIHGTRIVLGPKPTEVDAVTR